MQFSTLLNLALLAASSVLAAPSELHARNIEAGLSKSAIATLRKLNADCYNRCVRQCNSFPAAMVQKCFDRNCAPMVRDGRCLRNARHGTRDLSEEADVVAPAAPILDARDVTPAEQPHLAARGDITAGLSKSAIATLRKLNAGCYNNCVKQCNSFPTAMVQKCFDRNCAPMARDGRCLRNARHGTRDLSGAEVAEME